MTPPEAQQAARNAALVHALIDRHLVLAQVLKFSGTQALVAVIYEHSQPTPDLRWLSPALLQWRTLV